MAAFERTQYPWYYPEIAVGTAAAVIVAVFVAFEGRGCFVSDREAKQAVQDAGYFEAQIISRSNWFTFLEGCEGNDAAAFRVRVADAKRKPSIVVACSGWPLHGFSVRVPKSY
jgi:hypothetical protein